MSNKKKPYQLNKPAFFIPERSLFYLFAQSGEIHLYEQTSEESPNRWTWNMDTGQSFTSYLKSDQLPQILSNKDNNEHTSSYTFTAQGERYVAYPDGSLYRINRANGNQTLVLKSPVNWASWLIGIDIRYVPIWYPAVTVADEIVYLGGTDRYIYAIDSVNGKILWRTPLPKGASAPPIVARQVVYVGGYNGLLYALDARTGRQLWSFATGDWVNTPVLDGDTLYISSENSWLFALDRQSGAEQWRSKLPEAIISNPVIIEGVVYIAIGEEIGSVDFEVSIYAVGTPERLAQLKQPQASPPTAAPEQQAGQLYRVIATDDGFVSVRATASTQSREISRLTAGTNVRCTSIVQGQLLAGSRQWAYCPDQGGYIFLPLLEPVH